MAEELNDQERRETELWQVLDWSLWGNGLGDVLRTAMADAMVDALTDEQREQAEACIKAWHERRGPSMAVGEGTELQRQRDLLLWLHAEAVGQRDEALAEADRQERGWRKVVESWERHTVNDVLPYTTELETEVSQLRREVEFEAHGGDNFSDADRLHEAREESEEGSGRDDTGQAGREDIAAKTLGRGLTTSGEPGPGDVTATLAPLSSRSVPQCAVHERCMEGRSDA
jgi:hypothetical protein